MQESRKKDSKRIFDTQFKKIDAPESPPVAGKSQLRAQPPMCPMRELGRTREKLHQKSQTSRGKMRSLKKVVP